MKTKASVEFRGYPIDLEYQVTNIDYGTGAHIVLIAEYKTRLARWMYSVRQKQDETLMAATERTLQELGDVVSRFRRICVVQQHEYLGLLGALICDDVEPMVEELGCEISKVN